MDFKYIGKSKMLVAFLIAFDAFANALPIKIFSLRSEDHILDLFTSISCLGVPKCAQ